VLKGRILLEKSDLEGALASLQQAEAQSPTNVDAQYYMGIVYERFSQSENATAKYQKAAELEPANPQYAVAAAETMIDSGKVDEAVTYLNSRTAAFEHNAGVRQTLGHIAMLKGETEKAVGFFNEARLLAPEDDGVLEDLIRAQIAVGKFSEAQFNIEYILKDDKNKDRRDLKQLQARCLMNVDRPVEAREILIKLTSDPAGAKEVESWIELGNVSYILRDQNRLRMSSQRVLSMAPARMEGYTLRALWQRRSGDLNGALTSVDKAMEIKATDPDVQVLRALVLKDLGRVDEAREGYAAVLREDPENEAARKGMDSLKLATVPETASPAEQR